MQTSLEKPNSYSQQIIIIVHVNKDCISVLYMLNNDGQVEVISGGGLPVSLSLEDLHTTHSADSLLVGARLAVVRPNLVDLLLQHIHVSNRNQPSNR